MPYLWPLQILLACLTPLLLNAEDGSSPGDPAGPSAPVAPATILLFNKSTISVEVTINHCLQGSLPAGALGRITAAGQPQDAMPAPAAPRPAAAIPARWKIHGGWSTDQLPLLSLRAILPDGHSVQVDHVVHGDAHGSALVWFSFADAPGQRPTAEQIASPQPLPWLSAVPATPSLISACLSDASSDQDLVTALTDFYDHKGFWAGKFHLQDCISIAVGPFHDGVGTAYVAYHYQPLQQGLPFGIDLRTFTLVMKDGRRTVTAMGDYQSAADGGCRLEAAGDPALDPPAVVGTSPQNDPLPAVNPTPVQAPPAKLPSPF